MFVVFKLREKIQRTGRAKKREKISSGKNVLYIDERMFDLAFILGVTWKRDIRQSRIFSSNFYQFHRNDVIAPRMFLVKKSRAR